MKNVVESSALALSALESFAIEPEPPATLVKEVGTSSRMFGAGDVWVGFPSRKRGKPNVYVARDGEVRRARLSSFGDLPVLDEHGRMLVFTADFELWAVEASGVSRGVARFEEPPPIEVVGWLKNGVAGLDLGGSLSVWRCEGDALRPDGRFRLPFSVEGMRTLPTLDLIALESYPLVRIVHVVDGDARLIGRFDDARMTEVSEDGNRVWTPGSDVLLGPSGTAFGFDGVEDAIARRGQCPQLELYENVGEPDLGLEAGVAFDEVREPV